MQQGKNFLQIHIRFIGMRTGNGKMNIALIIVDICIIILVLVRMKRKHELEKVCPAEFFRDVKESLPKEFG
jgi:hypothetical protein